VEVKVEVITNELLETACHPEIREALQDGAEGLSSKSRIQNEVVVHFSFVLWFNTPQ
jgi:hypothetical protein